MKQFLPILVLVCSVWCRAWEEPRNGGDQASPQASSEASRTTPAISPDQENAHKAKSAIDQAITALGGQTYLTTPDRKHRGRGYGVRHGRPSGGGGAFESFTEFPDRERVELTKEPDTAELYV